MKIIEEIQDWYFQQCDGEWEHSHGIKIETLDNPGWLVKIDLFGTALDGKSLLEKAARTENDWVDLQVNNSEFIGAGGPMNLLEILQRFIAWSKD